MSQNLTLKGNFGLALKKCYFKFQEPRGKSFSLKSKKRAQNVLVEVSLLTNPSQYKSRYHMFRENFIYSYSKAK